MTKKKRPSQSRWQEPKNKANDHSKQRGGQAPGLCGQYRLKRPTQVTPGQLPQRHKTYDARRSLVGVEHNLPPGLRVYGRRVPPPFASLVFEVEPLLEMPGLIRCPQPTVRRDDVDGPVAHNQPLALRFWEHDKTGASGPRAVMELTAGGPQWRDAGSGPWDVVVAEGCFKRRDAALVRKSVWNSFALVAFVKITRQDDSTKQHAQIADEQQQRNTDGPPLGVLVVNVDVGDREGGA